MPDCFYSVNVSVLVIIDATILVFMKRIEDFSTMITLCLSSFEYKEAQLQLETLSAFSQDIYCVNAQFWKSRNKSAQSATLSNIFWWLKSKLKDNKLI